MHSQSFLTLYCGPIFFLYLCKLFELESKTYTMNNVTNRRLKAVVASMIFISSVSFSQIDNMYFLRAGTTDAVKIIEAYFAPYADAFGAGLNGGWYNTAKPHKLGGFDITTSFNIGLVPSSAGTYNVEGLGLTTLTGSGLAPAISGPKDLARPSLTKTIGGVTVASFMLPPGTGWKVIPVPTAQIGVGLPLGTELKVRYMPKINIKDGDISLWGVGLMHSIMQYIPGNKLLPVDVSVFGGYTKLMSNIPLDLQPQTDAPQAYGPLYNATTSFINQKMSANVEAWNISAIGSVKLAVVTIYGGLGYTKTVTDIRLNGNYPLPVVDLAISTTEGVYKDEGVINNFPAINIKNFSGVRANIGFRLKLSVITIHADYTRAQYNVLSAGLGISFR